MEFKVKNATTSAHDIRFPFCGKRSTQCKILMCEIYKQNRSRLSM